MTENTDLQNEAEFNRSLLDSVRPLRAFAISLSGKVDRADDLVQETLTKAWAHRDSFQPGSNMRAWLFTILRNEFYSFLRKRRREVEDADGKMALNTAVAPEQPGHLDLRDMQAALENLPPDQREALLLVSASDMSYEDAALICGVAVGTIKSRVNRARSSLARALSIESGSEFGPDRTIQAAIAAPYSE
ncbi:sigma-70 family RNA polymerase sigma factor [Aestuariivirga litoralis]|uniref:sigma-70 family RNA polymerase sigma factor n=1 Tax=Aestuariivirga litoralis TaxID=2650924 RepID=UPI0018C700B7|nr:sigma-70 family RNA polymerase sigma factor [Aestuariivirga litoralis]MBG1232419.1 sigma-70 family RNA polymerase sigma factor [Aestuariivirga litoralis]